MAVSDWDCQNIGNYSQNSATFASGYFARFESGSKLILHRCH